jgi:hypothetical protein
VEQFIDVRLSVPNTEQSRTRAAPLKSLGSDRASRWTRAEKKEQLGREKAPKRGTTHWKTMTFHDRIAEKIVFKKEICREP